jgi:hypothetical protein
MLFIGAHTIIGVEASEINNEVISLDSLDPSITISNPMSAEELISEYMKNEKVDYITARTALFPNNEDKSFEKKMSNNIETPQEVVPFANRYRTLEKNITQHGNVYFYCATSESPPSFRGIVQVLNAGYNTGTKIYSGTLYYNLVNANRIDFILNGHLYNSGTFGTSGGGSIGIGQSATLNFSVSYSTSYYSAVYVNSRVNF